MRFELRAFFIRNDFNIFYTLPRSLDARSSQRENSSPFSGIRCTLRCLTEAAPLSNLHGSKVQVVGWLVQKQSLCGLPLTKNAMHSHTRNTCVHNLKLCVGVSGADTHTHTCTHTYKMVHTITRRARACIQFC